MKPRAARRHPRSALLFTRGNYTTLWLHVRPTQRVTETHSAGSQPGQAQQNICFSTKYLPKAIKCVFRNTNNIWITANQSTSHLKTESARRTHRKKKSHKKLKGLSNNLSEQTLYCLHCTVQALS